MIHTRVDSGRSTAAGRMMAPVLLRWPPFFPCNQTSLTLCELPSLFILSNSVSMNWFRTMQEQQASKSKLMYRTSVYKYPIMAKGSHGSISAGLALDTLEDLDNISTYGFRGEALASIAEMSLLEITSKPRQQDRAYTVLFRGGDRLLLEESSKQLRYGYGTSVVVRDLFYKFPVRQRQVSQQSSLQDIEGVKRTVEKLALAAPHVNFVVIDAFRNVKVMSLRKADTLQSRIRALLGPSIASSLIAVHAVQESDGQDGGPSDIECTGLISTVGYFNQLHQHLFLNNRPIHSQAVHSAIHQLFQQSNFGKEKSSIDSDGRRVKERYPVYVLSLTCRSDWYDIFADPAKTTVLFKEEEQVVQLVRKMVARFLWEQHFMSRTMATSLLEQKYTGKKRKRPSNSTVTDVETDPEPQPGWDSHLHLPHVQPSRSLRIAPSSAVPFEGEDDWEGELIFELDSDWIHALTEDDFVPDDELEGSSSQNGAPAGMPRPPKPKLKRMP
ncbi:DNA mismatch repair protein [Actinomortierella wolfii]|nr:DNA mismatch repair protein [Actinomortierella wolfii]